MSRGRDVMENVRCSVSIVFGVDAKSRTLPTVIV
jgi:hypothetical protein